MADPRTTLIAKGLLDQTKESLVSWVETADEDEYKVVYSEYSVAIGRRFDVDGTYYYQLSIYNAGGTEVETLTGGGGALHTTLRDLFELARLKATGADEILNDLLIRFGDIS